ncbi:targeting protein for Xklp2 homolog [Saccoglossus kowalevskii]|uniref:Targeting protein for Xklp2 homolog n=1 Tax=Saccoglossus kowalevskii TaxID=10224 RepID=A0ABM0LY94_SACKO|nr:PREDICTED: targeting protein for Xklp2 homolog [Saccoglossus kowalevskii]
MSKNTNGPEWEYNAPQFVDFTGPMDVTDNADEYFNFDHENGVPVRFSMHSNQLSEVKNNLDVSLPYISPNKNDTEYNITACNTTNPESIEDNNDVDTEFENNNTDEENMFADKDGKRNSEKDNESEESDVFTVKIPKNLATSLTAWNSKTEDKRKSLENKNRQVLRQKARQQYIQKSTKKISISSQISNKTKPMIRKPVTAQSDTSQEPASKKTKKETNIVHKSPVVKKIRLTKPSTPSCLKRNFSKPGSQILKSSEELEMEKIAEMRHQLAQKRKQAMESKKMAESGQGCGPMRSEHKTTKPMEFHFATDERIKTHGMETRSDTKSSNFVSGLRNHPASPVSSGTCGKNSSSSVHDPKKGPTKVRPFHLHESRKRKIDEGHEEYKSTAVLMREFQTRTPERFKTKPKSKGTTPMRKRRSTPSLTVAKTPCFETKSRKRSYVVMSAAEKEEQEIEEMKAYKFKAHPVNYRILNEKEKTKKTESKPATQAVGFSDEINERLLNKPVRKAKEEEKFHFHAKPVPAKILDHPVEEEKSRIIHVKRPPQMGVPFTVQTEHRHIDVVPFSFEERDKSKQSEKAARIREMLEEEERARQFKAQPLPNLSLCLGVPAKKAKETTTAKPFHLAADERGAKKAEEWTHKVEEDLKNELALSSAFKAQPSSVLYQKPFIPEKTNKALIDIAPFDLNTERRSFDRKMFEDAKKSKEREAIAIKLRREKENDEMELEAVAKLRAEMVHKPNPIRHYKTVDIHPSDKLPTEAMSPHLKTERRCRGNKV